MSTYKMSSLAVPDLQRGVEHHQLGASGHQVIAAVGLHEASVHVVLRIYSQQNRNEILGQNTKASARIPM